MYKHRLIGKKIKKIDGMDKVTGALKFMTDMKFPGMLHAMVLRAHYPHALIKRIDTSMAAAIEGIYMILTSHDVPGLNGFGIELPDEPVLCDTKVRYLGDPLAIVIGETKEQVKRALSLIKVEYDPLPVYDTPEKAMATDAVKIHDSGNIFRHIKAEVGAPDQAFAQADLVVENLYSTQRQEHVFLETEGGIGVPNSNGGVTVYCPSQYGYRDRAQLSKILNLSEERIKIVSSPVGGAFGGKDDINYQALLAISALKTQRPVKIYSSREESFLTGITRQPFKIRMRTAVRKDGKFLGQDVHVICDTGAYASLGGAIMSFALENCCGIYYFPNVKLEGYTVYTNNQITGEFRGFGNNQMHFALESQIDIIAKKLGIDPIKIRKMNCLRSGQRHSMGHSLHGSIGALKTLEMAEQSQLWREMAVYKSQKTPPWIKRGVGVALCQHANGLGKGLPDNSAALIELLEDGTFTVAVGNEELGQGITTTMAIIAAEVIGVDLERIKVITGDTSLCPDSGSTTASRCTYITGNAVKSAAEKMKKLILETGAALLGIRVADVAVYGGSVKGEGCKVTLVDIAKELRKRGSPMTTHGISMPETDKEFAIGLHYMQSYLTQVVGVEVNTLTGKTDVIVTEAFPDAGKVINLVGYEGQVEGGTVMGLGYALMEDFKTSGGEMITQNLQTYLVPTAADAPEIRTIPVEVLEETGPFGAKGFGETPSIPITPAIINAIADAVGVRVYDLPADPEKVFQLLKEQKKTRTTLM